MTADEGSRTWGNDPGIVTELIWQDPVGGLRYEIRVKHRRNATPNGLDHVEIETVAPARAALPITETGYLSHFTQPNAVIQEGGADPFLRAWLNRAARTKAWRERERSARQGDLFSWSEANAAPAKRPTVPTRRRTRAEPS